MTPPKGHGEKQTRKREQAIQALIAEPTIGKAATACGIGKRTLIRWLKDPEFQHAHQAAKSQLVNGAINKLRVSATAFVSTLSTIAKNRHNPAAARVTAASRGLELLLKASEVEDLRARLEKLEELSGEER
jgi:hypothetical protein